MAIEQKQLNKLILNLSESGLAQRHESPAETAKRFSCRWQSVFADARRMGVAELEIIAGGPLFDDQVIQMIRMGKSCGWRISLNTQGEPAASGRCRQMVAYGLDHVYVSLHSVRPDVHNRISQSRQLWQNAVDTLLLFSALEKEFPRLLTQTRVLINQDNFQELPEIIHLHAGLGSNSMTLACPEAASTRDSLQAMAGPDSARNGLLLRTMEACAVISPAARSLAKNTLQSWFNQGLWPVSDAAEESCGPLYVSPFTGQQPQGCVAIFATGEVMPGNCLEMIKDPAMGNVNDKSLAEIWLSSRANRGGGNFDNRRDGYVNRTATVPLSFKIISVSRVATPVQKCRKQAYYAIKPALNWLGKRTRGGYTHPVDLNQTQYWPLNDLVELQNERLRYIIRYSYEHVEGYRRKFDAVRIKPDDIRSQADLAKIPILTRREMQEGKARFCNRSRVRGVMYSGGSSGNPLEYYECKNGETMRFGAHWRGWGWHGFYPGMKYAALKRAPEFVYQGDCLHLLGELTTGNLRQNVEKLGEFQPRHIKGYVNALFVLAKFCLDNSIHLGGIVSVIPSSENLYDSHRQVMEAAFGARVYEEYCCNDGGACGWECETREGIHQVMERAIIEPRDGEMIVTDLWNTATPFIRYENGDYVTFLSKPCSCGRTLPLIRVKGRANDILITNAGAINPSFILCKLLSLGTGSQKVQTSICHAIRNAQFVQKPGGLLEVLIVKNPWCTEREINLIKEAILSFSDNLKVSFSFVEDVQTTMKMKRSCIINEDRELLTHWLKGNACKGISNA